MLICCLKFLADLHRRHEVDMVCGLSHREIDILANILVTELVGKGATDYTLGTLSLEIVD